MSLSRSLLGAVAGSLMAFAVQAQTSAAAPAPAIVLRTVAPGDTLESLSRQLLEPGRRWQDLARFNDIREARHLRPGSQLKIPGGWLIPVAVPATVSALSGDVRVDGLPLKVGDRIEEGQTVTTADDAVVTLTLPDGSRLRIAAASAVRLDRLRRYHEEQVVDALIRLERGRLETFAERGRSRPLLIRTPHATAAVRGTEFRVGAGAAQATTEVLTGGVAWSGRQQESAVAGGFGSTADPQGRVTEPVALLPAPDLSQLPTLIESTRSRLTFTPVPGAIAYRVEIARDERFEQALFQGESAEAALVLGSDSDGPHHVRVRAIAPSRLEGFDAVRVLQVRARPAPPAPVPGRPIVFDETAAIEWAAAAGKGYRLQVSDDPGFGRNLDDRVLADPRAEIRAPAGGEGALHWRVATIGEDGQRGPFGQGRRIEWRRIPDPPEVRVSADRAELRIVTPPGHSAQLEVRWTGPTGETTHTLDLAPQPLAGERLLPLPPPPGEGAARLRLRAPDGTLTPYSRPRTWTLTDSLRSADGLPIASGGGGTIGIQGR